MAPLIVVFISTRWAVSTSLFGSFSTTSGRSPIMHVRGLLTRDLLTRRTSQMPIGASAGIVTLNLVRGGGGGGGFGAGLLGSGGGGGTGSALMPGRLKRNSWGSSTSVPVQVNSTVV